MPRDGSNIYHRPPGTDGVPNYTIESAKYNANVADVEQDLNLPRPIVAGGTGASSVDGALDNLSAEKFKQVVTNWDTNVWRAGSFYAATSATGTAPIPGKAFAGVAYFANATDFVLEATNVTDPGNIKYIRKQTAGVWGAWATVDTTKKNYIINGAMMVSQEWGSTALSALGKYPVDQFWVAGFSAGVIAYGQAGGLTPGGSPNRIRITVTAPDTSVGATDNLSIQQSLEGFRIADLRFGTASAKTVTIQFGVRAPAGTYCVVLLNGTSSRSYVAEYTITAPEANIDVVKSVTIPGSTTGAYATDNNSGMVIRWGLVAGANFQRAAGSYVNFEAVGSSNQYNFMQTASTPNNVFELFDVSLTEGASAPPFVLPDYGSELLACQRCYQVLDSVAFYTVSANFDYQNYTYLTTMRSSPVIIPAPTGPGMLDMTFQGSVNACFMLSPGASQTVSGGALKLDARM